MKCENIALFLCSICLATSFHRSHISLCYTKSNETGSYMELCFTEMAGFHICLMDPVFCWKGNFWMLKCMRWCSFYSLKVL